VTGFPASFANLIVFALPLEPKVKVDLRYYATPGRVKSMAAPL